MAAAARRGRASHRGTAAGIPCRADRPAPDPRSVHVVDEFPMTVTGTVREVETREAPVRMLDPEGRPCRRQRAAAEPLTG